MTTKNEAPSVVRPKELKRVCTDDQRDRTVRMQDTHLSRLFIQFRENPEAYRRNVRRLFAEASVMAQDFPAKLRFSYLVDRNGKLRPLSERRAGK